MLRWRQLALIQQFEELQRNHCKAAGHTGINMATKGGFLRDAESVADVDAATCRYHIRMHRAILFTLVL